MRTSCDLRLELVASLNRLLRQRAALTGSPARGGRNIAGLSDRYEASSPPARNSSPAPRRGPPTPQPERVRPFATGAACSPSALHAQPAARSRTSARERCGHDVPTRCRPRWRRIRELLRPRSRCGRSGARPALAIRVHSGNRPDDARRRRDRVAHPVDLPSRLSLSRRTPHQADEGRDRRPSRLSPIVCASPVAHRAVDRRRRRSKVTVSMACVLRRPRSRRKRQRVRAERQLARACGDRRRP